MLGYFLTLSVRSLLRLYFTPIMATERKSRTETIEKFLQMRGKLALLHYR
jgi:hypothetical protein